VSTPNILARKSGLGPLPYCKIGAKSEGYNRPGPLVHKTNDLPLSNCVHSVVNFSLLDSNTFLGILFSNIPNLWFSCK
jgi:hypothetical protein